MRCYAGIDLHATNSVVVVLDDEDRVLYQRRLRNELPLILTALEPYRFTVRGIAVESTNEALFMADQDRRQHSTLFWVPHHTVPDGPQFSANLARTMTGRLRLLSAHRRRLPAIIGTDQSHRRS